MRTAVGPRRAESGVGRVIRGREQRREKQNDENGSAAGLKHGSLHQPHNNVRAERVVKFTSRKGC
ncbi:MAG: hypothetical protein MZV63_14390 [Marinilabiliales bacterium]|nr:hypothetical protein [Marinilabiliales bacterium]